MIGAIIGDTVGSVYEFDNVRHKDFVMFNKFSFATDDSIMTLAVAEILQKGYINDKEKIIDTFKKWGRTYPDRGYGGRFASWLFSSSREAYKSYGNGAAMRVSPVGWYARNEEEVKEYARRVTEVTHNHIEGLKGAEVTAMCVYYARIGKDKEFIKNYVKQYYNIDFDYEDLRKNYYFNETCQNSVPQAIFCFLISKDFEDCIRTTISIGGDCDTTAAISCAIAEAYYKHIDEDLIKAVYDYLPTKKNGCNALEIINNFNLFKNYELVISEEITESTIFMCIENSSNENAYRDFIHSKDCNLLINHLTMTMLYDYFSIEDDDLSKDLLIEGNIQGCIDIMKKCMGQNESYTSVVDTISMLHNKYHNSFSFVELNEYVEALNKVISPIRVILFNNYKDALVYKNKLVDPSLIKIFNDGI